MTRKPDIVLRGGKPAAVILDIRDCKDLLERVEDVADLNRLKKMRRRGLRFKRLTEFLSERRQRV